MEVKFIVIEGPDGTGKSVQASLLVRKLRKVGYRVQEGDFPRYETSVWGKLAGRFLNGEFGKLGKVSPYLAVLPYMLDEYTWSRDVALEWIKKGGLIVSNRYFTSNVHQVAKLSGSEQDQFRDWLWTSGYDELGILRPDMVIMLDVNPGIAKKLSDQKGPRKYLGGRKKDIAEKDFNHQAEAYKEYVQMTKVDPKWIRVSCVTGGKLDGEEVIADRIWRVVEPKLR
jgi:dTMP kinase